MTRPPILRTTLTQHMQTNLADYETTIREVIGNGVFLQGPIVVCRSGRAKGEVYRQRRTIDVVPTFTTSSKYLFMMSTADMDLPDAHKELFKWVLPSERPPLQGFEPKIALRLPGARSTK